MRRDQRTFRPTIRRTDILVYRDISIPFSIDVIREIDAERMSLRELDGSIMHKACHFSTLLPKWLYGIAST